LADPALLERYINLRKPATKNVSDFITPRREERVSSVSVRKLLRKASAKLTRSFAPVRPDAFVKAWGASGEMAKSHDRAKLRLRKLISRTPAIPMTAIPQTNGRASCEANETRLFVDGCHLHGGDIVTAKCLAHDVEAA
jgi:hypothetical protein